MNKKNLIVSDRSIVSFGVEDRREKLETQKGVIFSDVKLFGFYLTHKRFPFHNDKSVGYSHCVFVLNIFCFYCTLIRALEQIVFYRCTLGQTYEVVISYYRRLMVTGKSAMCNHMQKGNKQKILHTRKILNNRTGIAC